MVREWPAVARLVLVGILLGAVSGPGPAHRAKAAEAVTGPARAALVDTGGKPAGVVGLTVEGTHVRVDVAATGLTPGFHGFHVHTKGLCEPGASPPFSTAGGHLGSEVAVHAAHAGDLPSLLALPDGSARASFLTDRFTLTQLFDSDGAAVIIHAGADNFGHVPPRYKSNDAVVNGPDATTQATGDSGDGVACGVVTAGRAALPAGYFLVAADGGVFAFGVGVYRGGRGGQPVNRPVVGMALTPGGDGYYLVSSDGGVFTYGDATFAGSTAGRRLNAPIVSIATVPFDAQAALVDNRGITVGVARLREGADSVRVEAEARNLSGGFHGVHVHGSGLCDPATDFSRAGGHLGASDTRFHPSHPGDLPPLLAGQDETALGMARTDRFRVADLLDADGSALVVHAGADNFANIPDRYSPPPDQTTRETGDSGTPVACGPVTGGKGVGGASGYWLAASDGGVFNYGDASFLGSAGNVRLNRPIVALAPTPTGGGYWLAASDGGIFNYGDAPFVGSAGDVRLNRPIVALAPTPSGRGYWLAASDGGIFNYGDAGLHGSLGGTRLNSPIVSMAATSTGDGYWLFAADGGVFAFGDAAYAGSAGGTRLSRPVVGAAALPY